MASTSADTKTEDSKKTGHASKLPTVFDKDRFAALHDKEYLEDDEEAEYNALRKLRSDSAKNKKTTIDEIVAKMKQHSVSFVELTHAGAELPDLDKLYGVDTIKAYADSKFGAPATTRKPRTPSLTADGEKKARKPLNKPLKSKKGEVGIWLAHPPKFLEADGIYAIYSSGKPIDEWLVDPKNKTEKIKFLKKLATHTKKVTTKEQLGDITAEEYKA